jgi:hypothetical protein
MYAALVKLKLKKMKQLQLHALTCYHARATACTASRDINLPSFKASYYET